MHTFDFDIRGQICPSTLLTALREVSRHRAQLKEGSIALRFLTDNRNATVTIPEAVKNMGYRVIVEKEERHYTILIQKDAVTNAAPAVGSQGA